MRFYDWTVHDSEAWSSLANGFSPMDHRYRDPGHWYTKLTVQESTAYRLLRWDQRGDRLAYRTPSHVRREPGDEHYWIVVPERGTYGLRYENESLRVPPGSASIIGLDETCQMHVPVSEMYALQIPRAEINHRVGSSERLRVVLDLSSGVGRVLRTLVQSVHAEQDNLSSREFNALCDRISELLCMMTLGDPAPQQNQLTETAAVVRQYVREQIGVGGDVRLPAVADALGWSPRQLRLALQHAGTTFRDVRQDEALRTARDLLEDPAKGGGLTIGEIAARTGFTPTWFSSAFKARYGEAPRQFRQRRLAERNAKAG